MTAVESRYFLRINGHPRCWCESAFDRDLGGVCRELWPWESALELMGYTMPTAVVGRAAMAYLSFPSLKDCHAERLQPDGIPGSGSV
jgi:hypothetical protein